MPKFSSCFIVLLGVLSAACGGGDGGPGLAPRIAVSGTDEALGGGRIYATTTLSRGIDTQIMLSMKTPRTLRDRVMAHEFLHAAGLIDHEASPDCFLYRAAIGGAPEVPCLAEIARLNEVQRDFEVVVHDERLYEHAIYAKQLWAHYAERDHFHVRAGP